MCKMKFFISGLLCSLLLIGLPAWSANQNALNVIEAESADTWQGATVVGGGVGDYDSGDWLLYSQTNFGSGVSGFDAWVAVTSEYAGSKIEIRLGSPNGTKIGELVVQSTGDWGTFVKQSASIQPVSGIQDLYLVASGGWGVANIDKFQFTAQAERNAFTDIEGESFNTSYGVIIEGNHVGGFDNGYWAGYNRVNFGGSGATSFHASVAVHPNYANQKLEIRLDSATGAKVGELTLQSTGGWDAFQTQSTSITAVTGLHDVFLVAVGTYGAGNVDKFYFGTSTTEPPPTTPPRTNSPPITRSGQAAVEIKNVTITGGTGNCITVSGATTSVLIDNVELSGCGLHGISLSQSANVVIQNSFISNLSHSTATIADGIQASNVTNLTIRNTQFADIYTDVGGKDGSHPDPAVAIRAGGVVGATIHNNVFQRVGTGFYAEGGSQSLNFHHNTGITMKGPYPRGQLVQYAAVTGPGNKIECNTSDNSDPSNDTEDNINAYQSSGTAASPLLIRYNRTRGGSSVSGSGIVVGDQGGQYIHVVGNRIVNPWNAGIGVASGAHVTISDNKIYKNLPGNSGEGLLAADFGNQGCFDITVSGNLIRWNEAGMPGYTNNEYKCEGGPNCDGYWSMAMNLRTECQINDGVSNTSWGTNDVNATYLTPAIYDEPIPQCN